MRFRRHIPKRSFADEPEARRAVGESGSPLSKRDPSKHTLEEIMANDTPSANEDRALVERARFGDDAAFERLVAKYQERTVYIARNFVLDDESARDVAQESFLRVYRCLDRYDPKYRFYTWFYRMVVHLAIDHVRRNKKPVQKLTDGIVESYGRRENPGRGMEQRELKDRVAEVLQGVPEKYRMLLVLRDIEGFTSKEISEIAGWNHATVRWRLHRARKLFRDVWETQGYPEEI